LITVSRNLTRFSAEYESTVSVLNLQKARSKRTEGEVVARGIVKLYCAGSRAEETAMEIGR